MMQHSELYGVFFKQEKIHDHDLKKRFLMHTVPVMNVVSVSLKSTQFDL